MTTDSPWRLYDQLLAPIDPSAVVDDFMVGLGWTWVRSGDRVGVSMTLTGQGRPRTFDGPIRGARLAEVADLVRSWNMVEASLGMAAVNCFYNTSARVEAMGGRRKGDHSRSWPNERTRAEAFVAFADRLVDKNVTVVGHFPNLEQELGDLCRLQILERAPWAGDFPDPACEYILSDQDYLFITGITLINKTLPRLLALADPNCFVAMVGPSVPLADVLFDAGVANLSGFYVTEPDMLDEAVRRGGAFELFETGYMVSVDRPAVGSAPGAPTVAAGRA